MSEGKRRLTVFVIAMQVILFGSMITSCDIELGPKTCEPGKNTCRLGWKCIQPPKSEDGGEKAPECELQGTFKDHFGDDLVLDALIMRSGSKPEPSASPWITKDEINGSVLATYAGAQSVFRITALACKHLLSKEVFAIKQSSVLGIRVYLPKAARPAGCFRLRFGALKKAQNPCASGTTPLFSAIIQYGTGCKNNQEQPSLILQVKDGTSKPKVLKIEEERHWYSFRLRIARSEVQVLQGTNQLDAMRHNFDQKTLTDLQIFIGAAPNPAIPSAYFDEVQFFNGPPPP